MFRFPRSLRARRLAVSAWIMVCAAGLSSAQVVSVNFTGREDSGSSANALEPAMIAGVEPAAGWLNADGATGTIFNAKDHTGAGTGMTVAWNGQGLWSWESSESSGDSIPAGPNGVLFNGYLDTTGDNGSHTLSVSGIPWAAYDVIVYVDGENSSAPGRPASFEVGGAEVWIEDDRNWDGEFVRGSGTGAGDATVGANYVRFEGLTGATFALNAQARTFRAAINGIQVVRSGPVAGAPAVENAPAASVTATGATLGGTLTDAGAGPANVSVSYGTTDGGTNAAAWTASAAAGSFGAPSAFTANVSGLTPVTTYFFRARAVNSAASVWAAASGSFTTPAAAPAVENTAAVSVRATTATAGGRVTSTGGEAPAVTLFYGAADGGTEPAAWAGNVSPGTASGDFSAPLSGLSPGVTYFHRARAVNSGGTVWAASSASFSTPALTLPAVASLAAMNVTGVSAVLRGEVTNAGGEDPVVTLFYGASDGGTDPAAWETAIALGAQSGAFSRQVAGLLPETDYHFRIRAVNGAGASWSAEGAHFATTVYVPPSVVINEIQCDEDDKTIHTDFVELINAGAEPVDLTGWRFTDGIDFSFPANTVIPAGGYVVVAENPAVIQTRFSYAGALGPFANGTGLSSSGELVRLVDAGGNTVDEVEYSLGFPWPTTGEAVGSPLVSPSLELINPALDNNLGGGWRSSGMPAVTGAAPANRRPTPGARNRSYSATAPPQIRQVRHQPSTRVFEDDETVRPGEEVIVSAKVTDPDGMGAVTLQYQVVEPGDFIKVDDARYASAWTVVTMRDDGAGGDAAAGDDTFSAILPATLQTHRRLVRYRITAADSGGRSIRAPQADDPQPNFAYFVYGTLPVWSAKATPSAPVVNYDFAAMEPVPVYQLVTTRQDHTNAQFIPGATLGSGYTGSDYLWKGALVYRGHVYDHIRYRARGGVWRYAMGKNMWKFDFNRGHDFQPLDNFGKPYAVAWRKLNFSSLIQQGDFGQRGEQGLFESAGFLLHNLTGNAAAETHYAHFRIIENAAEAGSPATQFNTDFQGLYLAVEQPDGRFLENHDLPDGNLYKMEGGTGDLNNQGPDQPSNKSDLNAFLTYKSGGKTAQWWKDNLDLTDYFSFRSIATAVHQYDIGGDKNFLFYHNPADNLWRVVEWDLDLTWTTTYGGFGTQGPLSPYVLPIPEFALGYRNRMREILDLLFNTEQTGMVLDETAQFVHTPGKPSFVDADRAMWDHNPILSSNKVNSSKAGAGRYYQASSGKTFASMLTFVKAYINTQRSFIQSSILNTDESKIPTTPVITYAGAAGYPANGLRFRSSAFAGKDGSAFSAMKWRIAEVTPAGGLSRTEPAKYEIESTWESGEITAFTEETAAPALAVRPGRVFRARVRHRDAAGRWSHWSAPLTFTPTAPSVEKLRENLLITEIMYHPADPTAAEFAAGYEAADFEFIELKNVGAEPLDLTDVRFNNGVSFDFAAGFMLPPGTFAVVVANPAAFALRHGVLPGVVVGTWDAGDKLDNAGEPLTLSLGGGNPIHDIEYDDKSPWPAEADGDGFSLTLQLPSSRPPLEVAESWTPSSQAGGSPGADDPYSLAGWLALRGLTAPLDDADGDGLTNLEEYAAGTDPKLPASRTPLTTTLRSGAEGVSLVIEVPRDPRATEALTVVEISENLNDWETVDTTPGESVETENGALLDRWTLPVPAGGAGRRFVRLRVSSAE